MKKIIIMLFMLIFSSNISFASEPDYRQIYMDLQVPNFSYIHGIDPGQYYDNKNASYSIYPLFRLCSPLYFKSVTIVPGYYDLTPRNHKGQDYILFKDCGLVKYTIPVYKKEFVPEGFYEAHIPKAKLSLWMRTKNGFYTFVGTHFKRAKRKPPVKTYLEVNDLDNKFVSIVVYFGAYRYYTIFRTVQM